ncbi:MAG: extracellular solute-binding protein [Ktedonobacteraceae bacterium]|nr:extracellular solute-binding protein [Ktedonobacteraceae bacterium]
MARTLHVALIGGPQYDELYSRLPAFEAATGYRVEMVARLPHPELNAFVAEAFAGGRQPQIDLLSTHIKYAPSQARFLVPLDEHIGEDEIGAFLPAAIQASRIHDRLMQVPRMVDARLLFYRTNLLAEAQLQPPGSWEELSRQAQQLSAPPARYGYVFPGSQSGLFGTFFELVAMAGGRLFDEEGAPLFEQVAVEWALRYLRDLYTEQIVPPELPDLYFDEVSDYFRQGQVAFAADWPAFYALYKNSDTSKVVNTFGVMRYPPGPAGRRAVYSGMHSFAIPTTARNIAASLALLRFLLDEESQWLEARRGAFPTRIAVLQRLQDAAAPQSLDARRLALLAETVREDMLMFPHLERYPQIEDDLWPIIQQVILGRLEPEEATRLMRARAQEILP